MKIYLNLVYKCSQPVQEISLPDGIRLEMANKRMVEELFEKKDQRRDIFINYLKRGDIGFLLFYGKQWVFYGWMSKPSSRGPIHLPSSKVKSQNCLWIFSCHTKEEWRRCGLYQAGIRLMQQYWQQHFSNYDLFIDTEPTNIAAQKAILSSSFIPCGIWRTYIIKIPRIKWFVFGSWNKDIRH